MWCYTCASWVIGQDKQMHGHVQEQARILCDAWTSPFCFSFFCYFFLSYVISSFLSFSFFVFASFFRAFILSLYLSSFFLSLVFSLSVLCPFFFCLFVWFICFFVSAQAHSTFFPKVAKNMEAGKKCSKCKWLHTCNFLLFFLFFLFFAFFLFHFFFSFFFFFSTFFSLYSRRSKQAITCLRLHVQETSVTTGGGFDPSKFRSANKGQVGSHL